MELEKNFVVESFEETETVYGKVRSAVVDGVRWYVARDFVKLLGSNDYYMYQAVYCNVDDNNRHIFKYRNIRGGMNKIIVISENALDAFVSAIPNKKNHTPKTKQNTTPAKPVVEDVAADEVKASACDEVTTREDRSDNTICTFANPSFGQIRTLTIDNEPWFVAADVCKALDMDQVTNSIRRLDNDEKTLISIKGISRVNEKINIINEYGLYSLILGSRKPEAKSFKRWITHEVIPAIRKHGAYLTPETIEQALLNPDFLIKLATNLKQEQEKNRILLKRHEELSATNERLAATNNVLSAKAIEWDARPAIKKLITTYGSRCFGNKFGLAWKRFYDQLFYNHGISLKNRRDADKKSGSYINCLRDNELPIALKIAVALCENAGISTGELIDNQIPEAC